jgi:galactoside 2-L-fucosyltransferase 1/2
MVLTMHPRLPVTLPTQRIRSFDCGYESKSSSNLSDSLTNAAVTRATGRYVSVCKRTFDTRRLGNHLFNFAAMIKAATLTGREVAMVRTHPDGSWLDGVFDISIARVDDIDQLCPCIDVTENRSLAYEWSLPSMMTDPTSIDGKSLLICGWNQSWKIHDWYRRPDEEASATPQSHLRSSSPVFRAYSSAILGSNYLRVGIHIRAGDIANGWELHRGYTIPDLPFFEKAIKYIVENGTSLFTVKNGERRKIQLIVATDDFPWVNTHLNLSSVVNKWENSTVDINLTFSLGNTAAFDLIMLSKCDVVIMTTGTYGWWAAWLADRK